MLDNITSKDIIKYVIIIGILYTILKIMPSHKLTNKDILLLVVVILIIFIIIDYKCFKLNSESFANTTAMPNKNSNSISNFIANKTSKIFNNSKPHVEQPQVTQPQVEQPYVEQTPVLGCSTEINKIKVSMQTQIDNLKNQLTNNTGEKYFNYLLNELSSNNILNNTEVNNIKNKINLKLLTLEEVITSLESLKSNTQDSRSINDNKYNELPLEYYRPLGGEISNDWNTQDHILNTDKWSVPMPRPPVCINSAPCKVCPSDPINQLNLKDWNHNARFTNTYLNKKWVSDNTINN